MLQKVVVTFDRLSVHTLSRCVHTLDQVELDSQQQDCSTSSLEGEYIKSVLYAPTIGSLMYVMVATRLDIIHVIGVVSRFMHNPSRQHWNVVKHICRYLVGVKKALRLFLVQQRTRDVHDRLGFKREGRGKETDLCVAAQKPSVFSYYKKTPLSSTTYFFYSLFT